MWTTAANVRANGTKKRRDRQFDESVAVLLDKLEQVAGRPLTPAQTKAIHANSGMPRAAKVFLAASIGAAVALTAYGTYRVSHPPTLKPPPVPSLP
ncbi:MAG TPA: hypothetical protein VJV22_14110 [Acidobacteriaceae bacterium]|nr:hypothetical protein [Acidobacteriaceae bacterium]